MGDRKPPSEKTKNKWLGFHGWLRFTDAGMKCGLCTHWHKEIESCKNFNLNFITGSKNYKISALSDHKETAQHKKANRLADVKAAEDAGIAVPRVSVTQNIPQSSALRQCFSRMAESEKNSMSKLFDLAYLLAKKGRPFSDFADFVELEKAHGVKYTVDYCNDKQCAEFVKYISKTLFDCEVKNKVKRCNFMTVLCDGSTDSAIVEKECIYVIFVDPDTFEARLTFFSLEDPPSQDADGLIEAIKNAFRYHGLEDLFDKIVFLCSDGANVNSGLNKGVAAKLRENELPWLAFVWCLSHRLELALKDSLSDTLSTVRKALTNLFYLYAKSSKKLRELRQLHDVLKQLYQFENGQVKPSKTHGTRWIAHFIRSMSGFVDKFGVYVQHLDNVIADTSKQCDKATLKGKREQLVQAEVLLKCGIFVDILQSAKKFSLASQFKDTNIMLMVERMDDMKSTYKRFLKKFETDPNSVFNLPTVQKIMQGINTDEDGCYVYQGVTLKYFERAKTSISNNICNNIKSILSCLENRFGLLGEETDEIQYEDRQIHVLSGDEILHDVCRVLDSRNWVLGENIEATDENIDIYFEKQLNAVKTMFYHYEKIFLMSAHDISLEKVRDQYVDIVMFSLNNINVSQIQPKEFWNFIHGRKDEKEWDHALLLIELCWCAPFSNATLERFFSQMKVVKTDWRNKLGAENLSHLLRVKVEGPDFAEFREKYCDAAVNLWYNDKSRRPNQRKRKPYKKQNSASAKMAKPDYNLPSIFDASSDYSSSSDED